MDPIHFNHLSCEQITAATDRIVVYRSTAKVEWLELHAVRSPYGDVTGWTVTRHKSCALTLETDSTGIHKGYGEEPTLDHRGYLTHSANIGTIKDGFPFEPSSDYFSFSDRENAWIPGCLGRARSALAEGTLFIAVEGHGAMIGSVAYQYLTGMMPKGSESIALTRAIGKARKLEPIPGSVDCPLYHYRGRVATGSKIPKRDLLIYKLAQDESVWGFYIPQGINFARKRRR
jgi:hypothetical protein